jgi:hypothetical protein
MILTTRRRKEQDARRCRLEACRVDATWTASLDGAHAQALAVPNRAGNAVAAVAGLHTRLPVEGAVPTPIDGRRRKGRRSTRAAGGPRRNMTLKTTAAVRIHRAGAGRRAALSLTHELAAGVRYAVTAMAAVGVERAVAPRVDASADRVASRHAELVELAGAGVARSTAAVIARGGDCARVVLVMADVALRIAPHRVATDADGEAGLDLAMHVTLARQTGAGRSAAIAVRRAQVAIDMAALCRLTDLDAVRTVGST